MQITDIRLQRLRIDLDPPFRAAWDPEARRVFGATLVFVDTDEGVTGVGSGDTMDGFEPYAALFVGQDPLRIARHVRALETIDFHAGRYWPLEAALWDIAGQVSGLPVATLFGGCTDRIPAYASLGEIKRPEERAEDALALEAQGFRALKLRVHPNSMAMGASTVASIRAAVADRMDILVDLNLGWRMPGDISSALDLPAVRRFAETLRDHNVLWLEEPLPANDVAGLTSLRAQTGMRIAGGEMARTPDQLLGFLDADALDVYQPDVVLASGMSRTRMLAELALIRNRWFSPHTWTNGLGLLANLHVAAGVGGGPYLEYPYDPPGWTPERRDFFLAEPVALDADGCVRVPDRPGLGAVLAPEAVKRYAAE